MHLSSLPYMNYLGLKKLPCCLLYFTLFSSENKWEGKAEDNWREQD